MKLKLQNQVRAEWLEKFMAFLESEGEDVGMIASNSCNFPIVVEDEEGWIEIVVKVPKDDGDEGYGKREDYQIKLKDKKEKEERRAKEKQKKIERDEKIRAQKKLERELRKS